MLIEGKERFSHIAYMFQLQQFLFFIQCFVIPDILKNVSGIFAIKEFVKKKKSCIIKRKKKRREKI